MDDLLVKSISIESLVKDVEETFETLRGYNLKLNPDKHIFGVRSGWFLGYIVTKEELS